MYTTDIVGEKKRKTSNILYNNANSVTKYAGGWFIHGGKDA